MKSIKRGMTVVASAFISICFLVGCGKSVTVSTDDLIRDIDVAPTQSAGYEEYSKQVLDEFFTVANQHIVEDEIDYDNEEVAKAAIPAAAKLFAYACYNERYLDQYAYFSSQDGFTDISAGSATAIKQEYYLRINEHEGSYGYRYHYTIKMVAECEGTISMFKSAFESARTRITDKTNLLYRLEGSNIRMGAKNEILGVDMLECDWETGKDWGKADIAMVKGDFIHPDSIKEDIERVAGEDNITIRANINILADNIVQNALIIKDEDEESGELEGYIIFMTIDTDVANKDEASLKMLRKANGSDDCVWVNEDDTSGLSIIFRIWSNGLFRTYSVAEKWSGKISGFAGTADSSTVYNYSYSDRDCDMTNYLKVLEQGSSD